MAAQTLSAERSGQPVVGVELRGDTMIYRPSLRPQIFEDEEGHLYRLSPVSVVQDLRHGVSMEIGAFPTCGSRSLFGDDERCWIAPPPEAFYGERYYYEGPLYTTGSLGLVYGYRVSRQIEAGATLSFAAFWRDLRRISDRNVVSWQREYYLVVMPFVRFFWLNRRSVRLYSAVQLGCQWNHQKYYMSDYDSSCSLTGQFTPFGIRVGRRLFGYAEWGVGARGLMVCGLGYSFGEVKK